METDARKLKQSVAPNPQLLGPPPETPPPSGPNPGRERPVVKRFRKPPSTVTASLSEASSPLPAPEGARLGFQNPPRGHRDLRKPEAWAQPPPLLRRPFPQQTCGPGAKEAHAPVSRPRHAGARRFAAARPSFPAAPRPGAFTHPSRHLRPVTSSSARVRPPQGPTRTVHHSAAALAELCASRRGKGV